MSETILSRLKKDAVASHDYVPVGEVHDPAYAPPQDLTQHKAHTKVPADASDDDTIQVFLFKSDEDESLGIQLNEFLVVVSVQEGSPADHANIPAKHRIVTVNGELVSTLQDFGRALGRAENPMEIDLRLVPPPQKMVFHPELVDKAVAAILTDADLDLSLWKVNPRYDFLNETSPYHSVFQSRYDAALEGFEFIDRMVEAFKAHKFAASSSAVNLQTCGVDDCESAIRWLDSFTESQNVEKNSYEDLKEKTMTLNAAQGISTDQGGPITEAPMVEITGDMLTLEEAMRISAEALKESIPHDPFLLELTRGEQGQESLEEEAKGVEEKAESPVKEEK